MLDAERGERLAEADHLLRGHPAFAQVGRAQRRLLYLSVVSAELPAVLLEDGQLCAHDLRRPEQIARVRVLRDEPQSLLLAAARDENGRMGPRKRLRNAQGLLETIVLAAIGAVVARPHLPRDLQSLLEQLETHGEGRERYAEPLRLLLVPGSADREVGAAAREHIERRRRLHENAGIAIDDAGGHGAELHPAGERGEIAERRVALQHVVLVRTDAAD